MKRSRGLLVIVVCVLSGTVSQAGVIFYDIDSDPGAWAAAIAGMTPMTAYDFGLDPDYGSPTALAGPLTSAGAGPVSAGILADGVVMDHYDLGGGSDSLAVVGPSAGYGNAYNAVVANYFVDAFLISGFPGSPQAFQFSSVSFVGGSSLDITVNDSFTVTGHAPGSMGVLVTDGTPLVSVRIYDPASGAEGVQGLGMLYSGDINVVPVPGALLLGTLGLGLAGWIRRRRPA